MENIIPIKKTAIIIITKVGIPAKNSNINSAS